uniref:Uncharacterized protein n=1 Tax=Oryza sativa subsp. japonica TaxID=39947 RepID=Q2QU08_ORYSJ|nr:hypothetical protein LOC_Os12g17890 [Oryza sativa Japonica Group]
MGGGGGGASPEPEEGAAVVAGAREEGALGRQWSSASMSGVYRVIPGWYRVIPDRFVMDSLNASSNSADLRIGIDKV